MAWYCNIEFSPTGINDPASSDYPFPFSQLSLTADLSNLSYTITNLYGQILERGIFSGEIILREKNITRNFAPGIYFVTYSDALDNRQVITDKVFVSNQ
jgi:hypothetical protein